MQIETIQNGQPKTVNVTYSQHTNVMHCGPGEYFVFVDNVYAGVVVRQGTGRHASWAFASADQRYSSFCRTRTEGTCQLAYHLLNS